MRYGASQHNWLPIGGYGSKAADECRPGPALYIRSTPESGPSGSALGRLLSANCRPMHRPRADRCLWTPSCHCVHVDNCSSWSRDELEDGEVTTGHLFSKEEATLWRRETRPVMSGARTADIDEGALSVMAERLESRAKHSVFRRVIAEYIGDLELERISSALEIGCGTGVVSRALAGGRPREDPSVLLAHPRAPGTCPTNWTIIARSFTRSLRTKLLIPNLSQSIFVHVPPEMLGVSIFSTYPELEMTRNRFLSVFTGGGGYAPLGERHEAAWDPRRVATSAGADRRPSCVGWDLHSAMKPIAP